MGKDKESGILRMFALACVAILLVTSMAFIVGSGNNGNDSNEAVTYEGLCGVASSDGNLTSATDTYVDSDGFVVTTCDGEDDSFLGEKEKNGELSESNGRTFTRNHVKYEIYSDNRLKVVDYESCDGTVLSYSIPDYIDYEGTRYTVTEIDEYGMTTRCPVCACNPKWVEVGPRLQFIDDSAFSAFSATNRLILFTIRAIERSELKEIRDEAFYGTDLGSIDLPKSLYVIKQKAFKFCDKLQNVNLRSETLDLHYQAFYDSGVKNINLGNVKYIGDEVFFNTHISDANLSSATEIGKKAFFLNSLHSVKFSPELTFLDEKAFGESNILLPNRTYHFYDTQHNEMGQCAELMHGKKFVRNGSSLNFVQVL